MAWNFFGHHHKHHHPHGCSCSVCISVRGPEISFGFGHHRHHHHHHPRNCSCSVCIVVPTPFVPPAPPRVTRVVTTTVVPSSGSWNYYDGQPPRHHDHPKNCSCTICINVRRTDYPTFNETGFPSAPPSTGFPTGPGTVHGFPPVSPYPSDTGFPSDSVYGWMPPSHCRGTVSWIHSSEGAVPPNAVHAGVDKDGSPIYAGRAWHEGDLLPAKVTPSHGCAYVSWGGQEIRKHQYEVMSSSHVAWQFARDGQVPVEAISCGHTSSGERLYLGRHMIDGTMTVGKIHPSHGCLYIPYDGREVSYPEYEVLVLT